MSQLDNGSGEPKTRSGFWERAGEHKVFSGFVGSVLVAAVAVGIAVANSSGGDSTQSATAPGTSAVTEATTAPPSTTGGEPQEPEEEQLPTPHDVGLLNWAEREGHEVVLTEYVEIEQATVDGITDPDGLVMELGESHRSAGITVFGNGTLQTIKGQVGIATEPCSPGSVAHVSVRGPEGEQLWPENGRPMTVHRGSVPFEVSIAGQKSAVLYAEAPEAEEGYCGSFLDGTVVAWVHVSVTK